MIVDEAPIPANAPIRKFCKTAAALAPVAARQWQHRRFTRQELLAFRIDRCLTGANAPADLDSLKRGGPGFPRLARQAAGRCV